jgi:hypothetical protein
VALYDSEAWSPLCGDCAQLVEPYLAALLNLDGAAEQVACFPSFADARKNKRGRLLYKSLEDAVYGLRHAGFTHS